MKTKLIMLVCVAMFLMSGVCFAQVRNDQIALGGIPLFATRAYVRQIYGDPGTMYNPVTGVEEWRYGDSFAITFQNMRNTEQSPHGFEYLVVRLSIHAANGITTPDGITVGDSMDKVWEIFGEADNVYPKQGYDVYEYNGVGSRVERHRHIGVVEKDGIITSIFCNLE